MTPALTKELARWKLESIEGKWRFAAFLGIYFISAISGLFLPHWFGAPHVYPGSDPPWYFIRQDFFTGVGHLGGMILLLLMMAATWRRYPLTNWMLMMLMTLWMAPAIVTAIIIYVRCPNFLDYPHAISAWPTFKAYSGSQIKFIGLFIGAALAFVFLVPVIWKRLRKPHHSPS